MKKLSAAVFALVLIVFLFPVLSACQKNGGEKDTAYPISVTTEKLSYCLDTGETTLSPLIVKMDDGTDKTADFSDFYYVSDNSLVYAYNGKLALIDGAPHDFSETLKITHKSRPEVSVEVNVFRSPISITGFSARAVSHENTVGKESAVVISADYAPFETRQRGFTLTTDYPHAEIDVHTVHVHDTATVGDTFTVTAHSAYGDFHKEISLTVTETIFIKGPRDFNKIRDDIYANYAFASDVNFPKSYKHWEIIPEFYGTINGRGYVVYDFKQTIDYETAKTHTNLGFIQKNFGSIINFAFVRAEIESPKTPQNDDLSVYCGAVASENFGALSKVVMYTTEVILYRYTGFIGGMVGINHIGGVIERSLFAGMIYGSHALGSISGKNEGLISSSSVIHTNVFSRSYVEVGASAGFVVGINSGFLDDITLEYGALHIYMQGNVDMRMFTPKFGYIAGTSNNLYTFFTIDTDTLVLNRYATFTAFLYNEEKDFHNIRVHSLNGKDGWVGYSTGGGV